MIDLRWRCNRLPRWYVGLRIWLTSPFDDYAAPTLRRAWAPVSRARVDPPGSRSLGRRTGFPRRGRHLAPGAHRADHLRASLRARRAIARGCYRPRSLQVPAIAARAWRE